MTVNVKWFKDTLAERRMSQRKLAKQIGLDASAISMIFSGKRRMQMQEAAQIANLLGVSVSDVMKNAGIQHVAGVRVIPVVAWIDQNHEVHNDDSEDTVEAPPGLPEGCLAAQFRSGDNMDRWVIMYPRPNGFGPECIDRYCVAKIKNGLTIVGHVKRGYRPRTYNVGRIENVEIEWASPVLWIRP